VLLSSCPVHVVDFDIAEKYTAVGEIEIIHNNILPK